MTWEGCNGAFGDHANRDNSTHPGDLGYFIGYRIVEFYDAGQVDKGAALREIIEMRDADDFLARSGYSPRPAD